MKARKNLMRLKKTNGDPDSIQTLEKNYSTCKKNLKRIITKAKKNCWKTCNRIYRAKGIKLP